MRNFISALVALVLITAPALAKEKPPVQAVIQAAPDKIRTAAVSEFAPHGYSIDSDTALQLQISRQLTSDEVMSFKIDHWITGSAIPQCRRIHTFIFLPGKDGASNVTMRWETTCQQPNGGEFRAVNDKKKELEWMQTALATIKAKSESNR